MKTREEFATSAQRYQSAIQRRLKVWRTALIVTILAVLALAVVASRLWPNSQEVQNAAPLLIFALVLCFLISGRTGGVSQARQAGLVCPSCHQTFTIPDSKLVLTTQNCPYCGQRVFEA
jgi:DNA-directed RNA polymerase subunit RPC12/RpoP